MKLILSIAMIAMIGMFTACEDDEESNEIFITERNAPETMAVGDTTELEFSIQSDADLAKIELFKNNDRLDTKEDNFKEKTSDIYTYSFTPDADNAGDTLSFALYVTDENDLEERYDFKIAVAKLETITVTDYNDKALEVALEGGTAEDLFSIEHGNRYSYNYVENNSMKDSADIIFGHEGITKALAYKLLSPDYSTSVTIHNGGTLPNTTNFNVVTDSYTFADITAEDIQNISDLTNAEVTIVEGDIVAFITSDGHKGFLKINAINNPDGEVGNGDDELTFDVKAVMASEMQ